jgi:NAD(P)-dependent dehydrogenase (short-subunit alcohol dehydrogenase family)
MITGRTNLRDIPGWESREQKTSSDREQVARAGKFEVIMTDRKIAVVVGAGSGIGNAIARRLVDEGYKVVGADVAWKAPHDAFEVRDVDVRNSQQVHDLMNYVVERNGSLDVVVNSAGVSGRWQVATTPDSEWLRVLDINLNGTFYGVREAAVHMMRQRSGRIVNIASNRGLHGLKNGAPYAASKGGVLALTKSAALELAPFNIGVFAILPGSTDTPLLRGTRTDAQVAEIAKRGLNKPEHVADAIVPLLSPDAMAFNGACVSLARRTLETQS